MSILGTLDPVAVAKARAYVESPEGQARLARSREVNRRSTNMPIAPEVSSLPETFTPTRATLAVDLKELKDIVDDLILRVKALENGTVKLDIRDQ